MQTSREDRIAMRQYDDQMNRQEKLQQMYKDEYYGCNHGMSDHDDLRSRERNYGLEEEEEW